LAGSATTQPPASSGFLNLLTLSSAPSLPALFHAGTTLGVVPYRALLLSRSGALSPAHLTLGPLVQSPILPTQNLIRRNQPRIKRRTSFHAKWKNEATIPDFRVLLHVRVRHEHRRFRPMHARGSPGLHSPPGCSLSFRRPGLHRGLPLTRLAVAVPKHHFHPTTGYQSKRDWLASREAADPPGVCGLMTVTNVRVGRGSGVTSSRTGVRHRPLVILSLNRLILPYRSRT
jgi:hypothetical protein